jgi:hypothetical protein
VDNTCALLFNTSPHSKFWRQICFLFPLMFSILFFFFLPGVGGVPSTGIVKLLFGKYRD